MTFAPSTPVKPETLAPVYRLTWIDARLHDATDLTTATYERQRDFKHLGAVIAWTRRQIFHGKVFGDAADLQRIDLTRYGDEVREDVSDPIEITLAGFRRWEKRRLFSNTQNEYQMGPLERRCQWKE